MTTSNTNTNDPDALRAEIEHTRANLSQNVNALGEAVQPSNIAKRQASKVTGAATGLKDKVMGSAENTASSVSGRASGVSDSVSGSVSNAGQTAKTQAQGNPMAAGLIALGAGWLLGSLLPASSREREAASAVKEQATPLVGQAQEMAKEAAEELKEPAMAAADSVKSTAQDAAETVKAEGQSAAEDVKSSAQGSKENVQQHQSQPNTSL